MPGCGSRFFLGRSVPHRELSSLLRQFMPRGDLTGTAFRLQVTPVGVELVHTFDYATLPAVRIPSQPQYPLAHHCKRLMAAAGDGITLDLNAVKQNSKTRKTGVNNVEIALSNIEKAQLVPEI